MQKQVIYAGDIWPADGMESPFDPEIHHHVYHADQVDAAIAAKDAELQTALRTLEALVAAGFVTQAKVDQARSLFTEYQPAPHPDAARLDKLQGALRNCLLLSMRRLHKGSNEIPDWEAVIRFCKEAGVEPSPLRGDIDAHQEPKP